MADLPNHIRNYLKRPMHLGVIALGGSIVCQTLVTMNMLPYGTYMCLACYVIAAACMVSFVLRVRSAPHLHRQHELELERRARAKAAADEEMLRRREELREKADAAEKERIRSIVAAADLQPGERTILTTNAGPIWATRCVDGSLRLWWAFNSRVRELAVPIIRDRARYVGDKPVAWFINRRCEASVLHDLSKI